MKKLVFFMMAIMIMFISCQDTAMEEDSIASYMPTIQDSIFVSEEVAAIYMRNPDFSITGIGESEDGRGFFEISPVPGDLKKYHNNKGAGYACVQVADGKKYKCRLLNTGWLFCRWETQYKTVCAYCPSCT